MKVSCPSCAAPLPARDVNVVRMVAKCRVCDAVFRFEDQLAPLPETSAALAPPPRLPVPPVPLPPGLELQTSGSAFGGDYRSAPTGAGDLVITRRWFGMQHIFLLFFAIFWNGFLALWYSAAISSGAPWPMLVFPALHLAAGIGITYGAVTGLVNRTVIRIHDGVLTVRHGPIPAFGNRTIPVQEIQQLFTEEDVSSKGARSYKVHAVVAVGPTVSLVTGIQSSQQALYLERTIEDHLAIPDQKVEGAFTGPATT